MFPKTGKSFSNQQIKQWTDMTALASFSHVVLSLIWAPNCKDQKLQDLHSFYWSVYLAYTVFIFCQKSIAS